MALPADTFLNLLRQTGAYLKGHFRLTSGLHSAEYLQCALVLSHPANAELCGRALAEMMPAGVGVVVSPAMGGLIIGHEVARALGVRHIFTERGPNREMTLRRGFRINPGERTIVIEDVITTGVSSREVVDLLRAAGADVIGAGSVVDRSGGKADLGVARSALLTLNVEAWDPSVCPLCAQGQPVVKPGSRPD